jgi:hypothetical protein
VTKIFTIGTFTYKHEVYMSDRLGCAKVESEGRLIAKSTGDVDEIEVRLKANYEKSCGQVVDDYLVDGEGNYPPFTMHLENRGGKTLLAVDGDSHYYACNHPAVRIFERQ